MPRDVFISHSAQDKQIAETICAALEHEGVRCWVAPRDVRPGKSFPGEITRAIQQCKVMLLIFSRHSNSSEQVLREVQLAVDCPLPIVRLRIEDIPLSDDLRYYLSTPQYLDALTPPLSNHIPAVILAIKELLGPGTDDVTGAGAAPSMARAPELVKAADTTFTKGHESRSRRMPAMAWAVVVVAALGFAVWSRSMKKTAAPPVASPVQVSPAPALSPSPIAEASPTATPTPSPSPSPAEKSPTPEPKPSAMVSQANPKGPLPKNSRAWQMWIDEFVHNFIASNETNDLDLAISFYAPNVELFEEGKKSMDSIRRDIEAYNARWPSRRATIRGDVRMSEKAANHAYAASFEHDYYVENPGRGEWINGAVAVELQITIDGEGLPKIVSMKQKTLRRDKGTMQKR
jgi:hypothetical protein